jgi:hypothetical protein
MAKINPKSPCEVTTTSLRKGGVCVEIFVPTYNGGVKLRVEVERDEDNDWRVYLPTADELDRMERGFDIEEHTEHPELISFFNGIAYFGAPDTEYDRTA